MGIQNKQVDVFDYMIFEKLVPKDHLLVQIDRFVNFSFVYDIVEPFYSDLGRPSHDPEMIFKMQLLEYLYNISDVAVCKRTQTDIAFRWFLGLSIDDKVPDDTALSDFRCHRFSSDVFNDFFNKIVEQCIEAKLIKSKRFMVDSTNVDANVNYPSRKKLIDKAFMSLLTELSLINRSISDVCANKYNSAIKKLYLNKEKVRSKEHAIITLEILDYLYLKTFDILEYNKDYFRKYELCYELVFDLAIKGKSPIISIVDPDARVAHKTRGNLKRGYKDHIIVDEDSEIILASKTTPFNVTDQTEFISLIENVESEFHISPDEISADTIYGTIENRSYLLDHNIISSIRFYSQKNDEKKIYGVNDFKFSNSLDGITCKNNVTSTKYEDKEDKKGNVFRVFKFDRTACDNCIQREKCLQRNKKGRIYNRFKTIKVSIRYDAVVNDQKRNAQKSFVTAQNKRYKVERRFATLVRNHGLRRSRFLRLEQTTKHVTMSNLACNVVRMINIIRNQELAALQNKTEREK